MCLRVYERLTESVYAKYSILRRNATNIFIYLSISIWKKRRNKRHGQQIKKESKLANNIKKMSKAEQLFGWYMIYAALNKLMETLRRQTGKYDGFIDFSEICDFLVANTLIIRSARFFNPTKNRNPTTNKTTSAEI